MRTFTEDTVDSRDIVARIAELEVEADLDPKDEDVKDELAELERVVEEIEGYSGDTAKDGITLIRDDYFEEYAQDFAIDIGAVPSDLKWPCHCIDWEQAADELKMDYTSVEIDGITYWYR